MEWLLIVGAIVLAVIWALSRADEAGSGGTASRSPASAAGATMASFTRPIEVVGESNYQSALLAAAGGKTADGPARTEHLALLVPEPSNPYDKNAVRVEIGGRLVGYLSRAVARELSADLRRIGTPLACHARITGGWNRGGGDTGSFGVVLLDKDGNE